MSISNLLQSAAARFKADKSEDGLPESQPEGLDSAGALGLADTAEIDGSGNDFVELSHTDRQLCRQAAAIINRLLAGAKRAENDLDLDYANQMESTAIGLQKALQNCLNKGENEHEEKTK